MTKHILTIELKGNNTYHGMSHSWVYEEPMTLYFVLFEKNTLFKDNISFELESLSLYFYFHYLYQLILIAEWKLYETACGGGVKTWRFWKHYSINIQLDKEKEIYLMFLKLETDKKPRKNMSTCTCKLSFSFGKD